MSNSLSATYTKVSWRLLPILFLCYVASYLDRVNIGFAKLQMLSDLKFSDTVYGFGAGVFFLGYFIFEIPSNLILHRIGARVWIARIMITWALISGAMIFVTSVTSFYILRFLLGIAEAGFFPGVILYLTYWYPARERGKIIALFMTGVPVSGVIGGPASGWIMEMMGGRYGLENWQWLFILEAIPSILLGAIVFFYLQDRIRDSNWLNESEKQMLELEIAREAQNKQVMSLAKMFRNKQVWLMTFIYFCIVMGVYGVSFWLPSLIRATGVSNSFLVGQLTSIPYGVAVIAMILVGLSADKNNERRWHVIIPMLFAALGLTISTFCTGNTMLALLTLTLATLGIFSSAAQFWSLPTAMLSSASAAAGIALINSFGNLAGFISPYIVGWLSDRTLSTNAGMYVIALSLTIGALSILKISNSPARN